MTTLTEFLLARIAEDEAIARSVMFDVAEARDFEGSGWYGVDYNGEENRIHGMRWQPSRVLAECEAKRRIVEAYPVTWSVDLGRVSGIGDDADGSYWFDRHGNRHMLGEDPPPGTTEKIPPVLLFLAQPYADHPKFEPAWRLD